MPRRASPGNSRSVGCVVRCAASCSRRASSISSLWYSTRVGHGGELSLAPCAGWSVKNPLAAARSASGQRFQPAFHFLAGGIGRIEICLRRARADAGHEGLVFVQLRPRSLVDDEVVKPRLTERRVVREQCEQCAARQAARPDADRAHRCSARLRSGARARRARCLATQPTSARMSTGASRAVIV